MKKLFTLVAFLAAFLGAKAEVVEDYKIDYSTYNGFPFYVMGYVPEWYDGVMTDFGANYKYVEVKDDATETSDVIVKTNGGVEYYKIAVTEPAWHQYFIADGIPTELDGAYTVTAMVKASEACSINVNMGWGWGDGQSAAATVAIGTDWQEVTWEYSGIGGTSCNLVAQPGSTTATIEWKNLKVTHNAKAQRPVEWIQHLENGDAEKPWADATVRFNDTENNYKICAWSKQKGTNVNENGGSDPFPAEIVALPEGGHAFIVRAALADTEGDPSAWDNQFWIESPKSWKSGQQVRIKFRYKASVACKTNTQIHKQNPSDYLHWEAVGDVNFTTDWQDFEKVLTLTDAMSGGWSVAFNLNPDVKDPIDFYFDDLSWESMKLDEGFFLAGCNTATGLEYDLDNAVQFVDGVHPDEETYLAATIGEKGKKDTYVNQIMISTVRGNDAAFKGATIKPSKAVVNDADDWNDYTEAGLAKINLPGSGVWTVYIDTTYNALAFQMIEGEVKETIDIKPNPAVVVVKGVERDWKPAKTGDDEDGTNPQDGEDGIGTGQPWDNQFFIYANRELEAGEVTVIEFDYVGSVEAKTTTQCHGEPGAYIHWAAINNVNFTTEEQHFSQTFTIPNECAGKGMRSIAFNMAEIKGACDYTLKNFVWKLEDNTESLINQTGLDNFIVKVGAGTTPVAAGITEVSAPKAVPTITVNLAGQRVSDNYKGIVVKNGKAVLNK